MVRAEASLPVSAAQVVTRAPARARASVPPSVRGAVRESAAWVPEARARLVGSAVRARHPAVPSPGAQDSVPADGRAREEPSVGAESPRGRARAAVWGQGAV
ncbi:hypothetical protein G4H71_09635 [Rhodococcus triatomae]|uniref:hypothetical protein n=1 Tax=Rhodococcus triatomae TaxID=300028 RepID=UPI0009349A17|nr:hypothetical protein [Rhodococcus triatomae]QNG20827.1 hypothetical protein G4H72_20750 [Rhodococcus triatomae]QNG23258.1 hypothetical protein G4H71_09635 [Rhodococcus triatomae]